MPIPTGMVKPYRYSVNIYTPVVESQNISDRNGKMYRKLNKFKFSWPRLTLIQEEYDKIKFEHLTTAQIYSGPVDF